MVHSWSVTSLLTESDRMAVIRWRGFVSVARTMNLKVETIKDRDMFLGHKGSILNKRAKTTGSSSWIVFSLRSRSLPASLWNGHCLSRDFWRKSTSLTQPLWLSIDFYFGHMLMSMLKSSEMPCTLPLSCACFLIGNVMNYHTYLLDMHCLHIKYLCVLISPKSL